MGETLPLQIPDLLIDAENPRLKSPNTGQREALRMLATHQGKKIVKLAEDILARGMNQSDLPIVMPSGDDLKRYIVLEGNRRLSALKILENPEVVNGAVPAGLLTDLRELSRQYLENPVDHINCWVVKDRQEAEHWISLKHTGENDGAGIVRWGADEAARFRARTQAGGAEFHSQALDLLEMHELLTATDRARVPASTLKRLLSTPEVREKCGIDIADGKLKLLGKAGAVAKALQYIVKDLTRSKNPLKVSDIYTKEQRVDYINRMPASLVVKPSHGNGGGSDPHDPANKPKHRRPKPNRPREALIPRDCVMQVTDARIAQIEIELRSLQLETYMNAVSVLFRVFVELSVDAYLATNKITPTVSKLRVKLQAALDDLIKHKKLSSAQATPIRRALQKGGFLAPSVDQMNEYVHDAGTFPAPSDLRAHWNNWQPFIVAMWAP